MSLPVNKRCTFRTPKHSSMERRFSRNDQTPTSESKWKSALLQRCLNRARKSRQDKFSKFRKIANSPLERRQMSLLGTPEPKIEAKTIIQQEMISSPALNQRDVVELEQLVMKELLEEEERLLRQYEEIEAAEAAALDAITKQERESNQGSVLCPICCVNEVHLRQGVFFCSCGFRLDAAMESMTLEQFRAVLANAFLSHASSLKKCSASPKFTVDTGFGGVPLLVLKCEKCNHYQVV
mmetsp:Transcript_1455/g.1737  ORF Transcript_1455/g.1737 Transcript_1455/m.1737 type:complete len:238 (+) Transcript_1455:198-911(+)